MSTLSGTSSGDNLKGTTADDTIYGGAGDDFLQGRAGGDRMDGGSGNDQIHGDAGDDVLIGGWGNDLLHGGLGIDTAVYSGSVRDYLFARDGENFYVTHRNGGIDGADRLLLIERLQFGDAIIDLTQNNAPIAADDVAAVGEDSGTYSSGSGSVLDNDFDWEGDTLRVTAGTFTGAYGTLVMNQDGTFTYTPSAAAQSLAAGQSVQDVFTYTVSDGSLSDTATLTFTLAGANDAPVAAGDAAAGGENQVLSIDVLANDSDVDNGAVLTLVSASGAAGKGVVSVVGNQLRFEPGTDFDHLAAGATADVTVSYTVSDEHGATSTASVTITVTGTNDAPVASADSASGHENQLLTIDVLANDSDADDGAVLTVTGASAPAGKGSVTIVNNQLVFDPGADFDRIPAGVTEQVVLTYTIEDEHGASSSSTVTVTVTGTNDGPVASADSASTGENSAVTVNVVANDSDVDQNAVLTVTAASGPAGKGSVSIVGNAVQFDPGADFDHLAVGASEEVVLSYTVSDEHGATSTATVTIIVTGTNDGPLANGDNASGHENQSLTIDVLANDTDADDGAMLTIVAADAPPGRGSVAIVGNKLVFDPGDDFDHLAAGASQVILLTYTVQDEHGAASSASVAVEITGTNDGPVARIDSVSTGENASVSVAVLANDSDVDDGAVLTVTGASGPAGKGAVSVVGNQVVFNPGSDFDHLAAGASEDVLVSYSITDEHGATSSSTVTITVTGANDGPLANGDNASGGENQVLTVDVLANDTDADDGAVLTLVGASAPSGKGVASIASNQLVFNPGTDFDHLAAGAKEIVHVSYTVQDQHGAASSATLAIEITGTNDGPVAKADSASTGENSAVTIAALANDTDVDDGAVLSLVSASVPAGQGSVSIVNNQLVYDPGSAFDHLSGGQSADVVITYAIQDEHGASASSTATVKVNGANDPVTIDVGASSVTGAVTELTDGAPGENSFVHQSSGTVAFDDADAGDVHYAGFTVGGGGYLGTFSLGSVDQNGDSVGWNFSVSDAALNGLAEGQVVTQVYTIYINEAPGSFVSQDVTITLTGKGDNSPPNADNDSYSAIGNVTLNVAAGSGVLANDYDDAGMGSGPGKTPVSSYDSVSANGGKVVMNADGSFSYMSKPGFTGTDSFTYTVTDADGLSDTATVTLTVGPSVWFVDNSAVGSANLGTQTDPFTSIASFNAAQGTANGPAANETIYVRKGMGTYTEADGFNLLSGQSLIGGEYALVVGSQTVEAGTGRPTIVTTGAGNHGVELSTNNSIKGLDIGSTGGAGISDGNGTVGNLYVYDVGKTGAGQILDIDQGGTLDVTLNYTQSTGSSGGAVDLHGVGGTVLARGWMNISGAQTGGGIDITGSSVVFTLAGGGYVSTSDLNANGVRFDGNTGSFNVTAGMFDVSTRAGTGLLFQNGGTVSMSGPSNNVSSFSGSAVVMRNVTSAGVTLEGVSSNTGANNAIILDNAGAGGFTITGLNGQADSGGVIGKFAGADGSLTQGSGIVILNTSNVSLAHMAINSNVNYGILGQNVTNFTLKNSVVGQFGNGNSAGEGSISFTNLNGTALFEGNYIGGGRTDNLRIDNSSGALDLTIRDSALNQAVMGTNNVNGNDNVFVRTTGSATLEMLVDGVEFKGARGDQLQLVAEGSSSHDLAIRNSEFHNQHTNTVSGGGGVSLGGGGAGSNINVDYVIEDNSFRGADGSALSIYYTPAQGRIEGYVGGNVVGVKDGTAGGQGSSGGGDGIFIGIEKLAGGGTASHSVTLEDNEIYDVLFGVGGISLRSNSIDPAAGAVLEAVIKDNVVDEMNGLAAFYAIVGGGSGSDTSAMGLTLNNNVFDHGDAAFGGNAVYLDQLSPDAHYYFPGYAGSGDGEYNGGTASDDLHAYLVGRGNQMTNGAFATFADGVDAGMVGGATGDVFVYPVWP